MAENNKVFRQKSLDRISSPEDLDRYIKTTTPSLWVLLVTIIIFLIGIIVWAVEGKLLTYSNVGCKIESGVVSCYIKEADHDLIKDDSYIEVEGKKIAIDSVSKLNEVTVESDNYLLHGSEIEDGEWYYVISGKCALSDTYFKTRVVYETVSAIRLLFN